MNYLEGLSLLANTVDYTIRTDDDLAEELVLILRNSAPDFSEPGN